MLNRLSALSTNYRFLFMLAVFSLAAAGGYYILYQNTQKELAALKENPQAVATQETQELVAKVGALVALPEGEQPTVATVNDKEKLKNQPFFAKAENGDKMLIYTKAKKAYLYSVSQNKILEVAPVNLGTTQEQVAGDSTESQE